MKVKVTVTGSVVVVRPALRPVRWVLALGGAMAGCSVGAVVADLTLGGPSTRQEYTAVGFFLLAWMVGGAGLGLLRSRKVGLVADDRGLRHTGLFGSRSFSWDEVASLGSAVDRKPVVAVHLRRGGLPVTLDGTASSRPAIRSALDDLAPLAGTHEVTMLA